MEYELLIGQQSNWKRMSRILGRRNVVPRGCLAVYVGKEEERFIISIDDLYHPFFTELLEAAKEKYGFEQKGPLRIPCDVDRFRQLNRMIRKGRTQMHLKFT
jgi:SAUR family protein